MKYITVVLILCLTIAACGNGNDSGNKSSERLAIKGVKAERIGETEVEEYYKTSGTVKAKTVSDVASRVMGTVTSVKVKEGDKVVEGEVLLTIDDRDVVERAAAAREGYREAQRSLEAAGKSKRLMELTYERYKNLYDDKAISAHEMDEIETQKDLAVIEFGRSSAALGMAKANMEEAEINLGFTKLQAPVSGVVTEKKAEVGDMALPGEILLRVEDNSSFTLDVNVDEKMLGKVEPGMVVYADIDALGREIEGRITEVNPAIDPGTRTFLVKIALDGDSLRTGLYASVLIPSGKRETILVPPTAVIEKGQLEGVYTVNDAGIVTYRLVRTGRRYKGSLEVLSGLRDGDIVITEGAEKAVDGGIVEPN
jgi:RND family efflux transporter MFP subunit